MAEGGVSDNASENVAAEDTNTVESVKMLTELAGDYAEYMQINCLKEKQSFVQAVDELLSKLDEYVGFVDLIRSDVNFTLNSTLASIETRSREMQRHFDRIDRLEAFMLVVKKNVAEMEHLVEQAESDLGSVSTVKKVLNSVMLPSLFTPKSQTLTTATPRRRSTAYELPEIFRTDDYFHQQSLSSATNDCSISDALSNTSHVSPDVPSDSCVLVNETSEPRLRADFHEHMHTRLSDSDSPPVVVGMLNNDSICTSVANSDTQPLCDSS